jgi:hypothetical protein
VHGRPGENNADLRAGPVSSGEQLHRGERRFPGTVFVLDPLPPAGLAKVLAQ